MRRRDTCRATASRPGPCGCRGGTCQMRTADGLPGWQSTVAGMREPDLHIARAAYDAIAPVYADHFKDTLDNRPTERALLAAFAEMIQREPAGIVADLGCGPGHIAAHLHGLGLSVLGVDQ